LRAGCLSLADPDPLSVFDNVLSTPSSWLERQKSQYAAYLATFEAGN
jgi:2-oxoisovalerate dehydrogenase E1 component alpha subunit